MPLRELNHITVVRNSLIYSFSAVWYAIFSVPMELLPQMCRNFAKTVESFVNVVSLYAPPPNPTKNKIVK